MTPTDEIIVAKIQADDSELFGEIIDRYEQRMRRYARRFLVFGEEETDVVQDIFVKAYENINSFDTKKKFSSWIYRIAHNHIINILKKREHATIPWFHLDTIFPHPYSGEDVEEEITQKEIKEMIETAIKKLPIEYREVLVLFYFENMSYAEIAEILSIPQTTVGVRISRSKQKLRSIISNNKNL